MRSFTIVLALGAAAVTLHGCGGGGSGTTPAPAPAPCVNEKVDFVTQSVKGTTSGDLFLDIPVTSTNPIIQQVLAKPITSALEDGSSFDLKFDLEAFKATLTSIDKVKVTVEALGIPIPIDVTAKAIFDAGKKELVLYVDASVDAMGQKQEIKNCTVATIDEVPPIKNLTQELDQLKKVLQESFTCKGNDGTYDDFKSPDISPLSPTIKVDASADLKMDKDYLWGEIDLDLKKVEVDQKLPVIPVPEPVGNITINSIHANASMIVKVSEAAKGGPQAGDMDYSGWDIKCIPSHGQPMKFQDLKSVVLTHITQARAKAVVAAVAVAVSQKAKLVTV